MFEKNNTHPITFKSIKNMLVKNATFFSDSIQMNELFYRSDFIKSLPEENEVKLKDWENDKNYKKDFQIYWKLSSVAREISEMLDNCFEIFKIAKFKGQVWKIVKGLQ